MIADLKILAEYPSPSLLFFVDEIKHNIDTCLSWVGNQPERLRMHVKTHKCPEVVKIQLAKGLTKHKAATIPEAQMLAMCGAPDVFIAYPMVGPNLKRLANLIRKYEGTTFSVSVDHPEAGEMLGNTMTREGLTLEVLLDFDMGFKRTGFPVEAAALDLYRTLASTKGIKALGFHTYDGHNQLEHHGDRLAELDRVWSQIMEMRATLEKSGIAVPKIISGGTPTFILYSKLNVPGLECSPGTLTLHDFGYGNRYTELKTFKYGAGLLTRVISKQGANGITVDLGYKAVSGDQPPGKRCIFPNNPEFEFVGHSEEHLMLKHPNPEKFNLGDSILAVPVHICPTTALHRYALAIANNQVIGKWEIVGRDRDLGC